jgi:hypothetical protein
MMNWLLVAVLVVVGGSPLRICTCLHEDEPVLAAAGDAPHPHCDCPVVKPVQKLPAAVVDVPVDSHVEQFVPAIEAILVDADAADFRLLPVPEPPSTPRYVTLRALRN